MDGMTVPKITQQFTELLATSGRFRPLTICILASSITWMSWYLLKFYILPTFRPSEPRSFPYYVPYLGHALSFFNNADRLITKARAHFGNTGEPFIIETAGQKMYILTSADDAAAMYKNTADFSLDEIIKIVHRGIANVSPRGFELLWPKRDDGAVKTIATNKDGFTYISTRLLHKQLFFGAPLENITERFLNNIESSTQWDAFFPKSVLAQDPKNDERVVSIHQWTLEVLVNAVTRSFFGDALPNLLPDISTIFDQWDMNSYMTNYQYPAFLSQAAIVPREKIIRALTQYFDLPHEERNDAIPFIRELEEEQHRAGLSNEDAARLIMIVHWGINTNIQKTTYWLLLYLFSRPSLLTTIQQEITAAITPKQSPTPASTSSTTNLNRSTTPVSISHTHLTNSCPHLNSLFDETIRITSTTTHIRCAHNPVHIHNKLIPASARVIVPVRQLMLDPSGFGPDAAELDPERFLRTKNLERSPYYRPFGGGEYLCSGRHLGRRAVLGFVAIVLWRYEVGVVKEGESVMGVRGKKFPRLDLGKPSLGISMQVEGDDMVVVVRPRVGMGEGEEGREERGGEGRGGGEGGGGEGVSDGVGDISEHVRGSI